ncbi:MAG: hypothetical protein LLG08_04520 [Actinomycetia bacterium]|nr:hypothetical protein [Actinomycetes bacterium]
MSPTLIAAVVVVIIASAATVAVGAAYQWQVTSRGYGVWTRGIGVGSIVALTALTAWSRRGDGVTAVLIGLGGVALAAGYLWVHVRLTKTVRDAGVDASR